MFDLHISPEKMVCCSGGAPGSDTIWEINCIKKGIKVKAFSYKTPKHISPNKVEISDDDYNEGIYEVNKANKHLGRFGIHKYMNLLARNWAQVKYSDEIFAIGYIVEPGGKGKRGYKSKSKFQTVDGGSGYCCQMAINNKKPVNVFDQDLKSWFRWSYNTMSFIKCDEPIITSNNFAGIGTREITSDGIKAIESILDKTIKYIETWK
jgi:hypothetical protein